MRFYPLTLRALLLLLALFAVFMLGVALVAQYGYGLHPCELCMAQRYPYCAILAFGAVGYFLAKSPKAFSVIIAACIALLLVDSGIAFYHAGVELGWFPAPDACAANSTAGQTLEEMRAAILNAPLVSCAQAMAHVFGLSLAAWNGIAAMIAAVYGFIALRKLS
jgi:disulfide bond formation protein DsbB